MPSLMRSRELWKNALGHKRVWAECSRLGEKASPACSDCVQYPSVFRSREAPFLQVQGEHFSHEALKDLPQGRAENPSCTCCFSNSFSLKYSVCQQVKMKYRLITGWSQDMRMFFIVKAMEETLKGTRKKYRAWICNINTTDKYEKC